MMGWIRRFGFAVLLAGAGAFLFVSPARGQELTNAAQVLSLSAEEAAKKLPVRVTGIVTAAEGTWNGKFFVQDQTSGVFVGNSPTEPPVPGDVVEVIGSTYPGAYAPTITRAKWKKIGTAELPEPRHVPIEQIMSGAEDGQRVEVVGIVRAITPGKTNIDVVLTSGGYRFHAFPKTPTNFDALTLLGARVRIRGTAAASFKATLRHMLSVVLFVPLDSDFVVEQTEPADPFSEPALPLNSVAQYRRDLATGKRVHVQGVVTLQRSGEDLFLEDATGGLQVRTHQAEVLAIGDVVEAVGFPDFDHFLPVLEDAVFRRVNEPPHPLNPKPISIADVQAGLHHADLVTLSAKVIDRAFRTLPARSTREPARTRTVLMLQRDDLVFTAVAETPQRDTALAGIPIGSIIQVSGVCFTETGEDKKLKSLQLLLSGPEGVLVLQHPSWFTPQRLFVGLGVLLGVAVVAILWTVMVSRRNAVLQQLVHEKEKAQAELQQAHDLLEERVKERTEQLKFQITARKESELQFKAVLSERTRLAQELHDGLEQTLTGIALQLDASSALAENKPAIARHHLGLARQLVDQGQVDVRRSVWDLRSRALEQFDLPGALAASVKQLVDGTNIRFEVNARGQLRPLPETLEENLLRIAQEAITNVFKHSHATSAELELEYLSNAVTLRIKDNGRGFILPQTAGAQEGHFGLLGMTERAKRLGAQLEIQSAPGEGTLITMQVSVPEQPHANGELAATPQA